MNDGRFHGRWALIHLLVERISRLCMITFRQDVGQGILIMGRLGHIHRE